MSCPCATVLVKVCLDTRRPYNCITAKYGFSWRNILCPTRYCTAPCFRFGPTTAAAARTQTAKPSKASRAAAARKAKAEAAKKAREQGPHVTKETNRRGAKRTYDRSGTKGRTGGPKAAAGAPVGKLAGGSASAVVASAAKEEADDAARAAAESGADGPSQESKAAEPEPMLTLEEYRAQQAEKRQGEAFASVQTAKVDDSKLSKAKVIDRSAERAGPVDVSSIIDASSLGQAKTSKKKKSKKSRTHARDVLEEDISAQLGSFRSGDDRPPRRDDRPPRRDGDRPPRRDGDRPPRRDGDRAPRREGDRPARREGGRGRGRGRDGGRGRGRDGPRTGGRGGGARAAGRGRPSGRSTFDEAAEFPSL